MAVRSGSSANTLTSISSKSRGLAGEISKGISALKRIRKFYWRSEAPELDRKVSSIRLTLVEELAPIDLSAAIKGVERLLDTADHVFNHVDDSDGCVWPVYQQLVEDLAELYGRDPKTDRCKLAEKIFGWHTTQQANAYDHVVQVFGRILGDHGLETLELLYREEAKKTSAGKGDDQEFNWPRLRAIHALLDIADARGDVDEYVGVLNEFGGIKEHNRFDLAKRLAAAGRYEEALEHLALYQRPHECEKISALRAEALRRLGRFAEAEACLSEAFVAYPDSTKLTEILANAADAVGMREKLLLRVERESDKYRALAFFLESKDLKRAAALVLRKREEWSGQVYQILSPAAKVLSAKHPLEATILYRVLIDDVLARAQSRYYSHAVRYLKAMTKLEGAIKDWAGFEDHSAYVSRLQEEHKRKGALWAKLGAAGWTPVID